MAIRAPRTSESEPQTLHEGWSSVSATGSMERPAATSPEVRSTTLGQLILKRRRELGLTQEQLADRISLQGCEIRQSDISRLERDQISLPRYERLSAIATALGISVGEMLARSGWIEQTSSVSIHVAPVLAPAPARPPAPVHEPVRAANGPLDDVIGALRATLSRSQQIRAESQELRRRSMERRRTGYAT
jgi:transcriptional regulator with XRE-family HTH domain